MKTWPNFLLLRLSVVAALVVALGSLGFAHRMVPTVDAELIQFVQAGGTLSDICDDADDSDHLAVVCEACNVASAADVPSGAWAACGNVLSRPGTLAFSVLYAPSDSAMDHTRLGRAPPFV